MTIIRLNLPLRSSYQEGKIELEGLLIEKKIDGNQLTLTIQNKERIQGYYTFSSFEERNFIKDHYHLGDTLLINGTLEKIQKATTPYVFSYQENAFRKKHFFNMKIDKVEKVSSCSNPIYRMKNHILERIEDDRFSKIQGYLQVFLLGDNQEIAKEVKLSYQENGISHLFALSGMHISLFCGILLSLFQKIGLKEKGRYFFTFFFLIGYLLLSNGSASILRATIFFLLSSCDRIYALRIKPLYLFYATLSIVLFWNPFFVYEVGFQFSFSISFYLLFFHSWIECHKNDILKLFQISFFAFVASVPIALFHFSQINVLSIFYNLYFVPLVSFVVFPLVLLSFCFPPLVFLSEQSLFLLEKSSLWLSDLPFGKLIFMKPLFIISFLYFLVGFGMFYVSKKKKKFLILIYLSLFFGHYFYPDIVWKDEMIMLDIGQGDSILFHSKNKTALIDTGGKIVYQTEEWEKREIAYHTDSITIPFLKALGIKKIDFLILTHGDADHLGEADHLIDRFLVSEVFMNLGPRSSLEDALIKKLEQKKIPYRSIEQNEIFSVGNFVFQSLNRALKDENDSSLVFFVSIFDYSIMMMADATMRTEKMLLEEYTLPKIDILKVGHHGSKSSTSEDFLKAIQPKIALISAGFQNQFHHPDRGVLDRLDQFQVKTYVTKEDGTIRIQFNRGTILTYPP